jgi:hypothetical protein
VDATVTVHIADLAPGRAIRTLVRPPKPDGHARLVHADVGAAAPLREASAAVPQPRRVALISFWRDRASADAFCEWGADAFAGGWYAVLEPIRAHGTWPGLPRDLHRGRTTDHRGPSVVLTLGRLRLSQARRFLRTSEGAERAALASPGLVWGTALARPPFVATCSLWDSTAALSDYAYGEPADPHPQAIAADRADGFHRRSAFVRFRPLEVGGSLSGRNPLAAGRFAGARVSADR